MIGQYARYKFENQSNFVSQLADHEVHILDLDSSGTVYIFRSVSPRV